MKIFFDMDGTIADFYGVEGWLDSLIEKSAKPYEVALPLLRMSAFARVLHRLQKQGYEIGIISWLAKNSNEAFDRKIIEAKESWLKKRLPSVVWDEIHIVPYGYPKETFGSEHDLLFDDEEKNRDNWKGWAFEPNLIMEVLKAL